MMVKQLPQHQYETILHLFHNDYPNLPLVFGVIEQSIPGQVWVDDITTPKVCLVMTGAPYSFIAGKIHAEVLQDFIEILQEKPLVKLVVQDHDAIVKLTAHGFTPVLRRLYRYKNNLSVIPKYANTSGYEIKKITSVEILKLCAWGSQILSTFGSAENFLNHGIGFIL